MTDKTLFSPEEWQTLKYSVLWIFHAIAEIDGVIDAAEGAALMDALKGGLYHQSGLMDELMADISPDPKGLITEFEKDKRGVPMGLKEAAELVEKKLDVQVATDFKRTLLFFGVTLSKVANQTPGSSATSKIGDQERAAILTVAAILRLSLQDLMI